VVMVPHVAAHCCRVDFRVTRGAQLVVLQRFFVRVGEYRRWEKAKVEHLCAIQIQVRSGVGVAYHPMHVRGSATRVSDL